MHAKGIEGIIVTELGLHDSHHPETNGRGYQTDEQRTDQIYRTGCRRDGHQTPHRSAFLVDHPVDGRPSDRCHARGDMRHQERVGCQTVGSQAASGIEPEPTQPKQCRA